MRKFATGVGCALVFVLTGVAIGQDDPAATSEAKPQQNLEMNIELTSTIMTKMVEKGELTEEQKKQVREIIDQFVPDLVRSRFKLQNLLTDEQQSTYQAALKMARNAKYTPEQAADYALRKLKLEPEEAKNYNDTRLRVEQLDKEIIRRIGDLLSDEQKARLPMFGQQQLTTAHAVKLPNMKDQKDAAAIWLEIKKIKGVSDFQPDVAGKLVKFKAPRDTDVKSRLAELAAANESLFKDWELVPMPQKVKPTPAKSGK